MGGRTRGFPFFSFYILEKGFEMQLKKIDMESKRYQKVRKVVSDISGAGTIWTYEAVVIPFVQAVWSGNKLGRLMRIACYAGIISTGTVIGLVGKGCSETVVDILAEGYNGLIDGKKEEDKPEDHTDWVWYNKEGEDLTTPEDITIAVDSYQLFEFGSDEEARAVFTALKNTYEKEHSTVITLLDFAWHRGIKDISQKTRNQFVMYGWEKIETCAIEKIHDGRWYLYIPGLKQLQYKTL